MFAHDSNDKRLHSALVRFLSAAIDPGFLEVVLGVLMILAALFLLSGCVAEPVKPIVQTVTIDRPVPVLCRIPPIERPAWETERANAADPVTASRAIRAELEQRRAYEVSMEAAARACQ